MPTVDYHQRAESRYSHARHSPILSEAIFTNDRDPYNVVNA
jgi:hypothetical protein